MTTLKFIFIAAVSLMAYAEGAPPVAPSPEYAQLKTYRTYYGLSRYQGVRHNFRVWFRHGPDRYVHSGRVNADTPAHADQIQDLGGGFVLAVGNTEFPQTYPDQPVPAGLEALTQALEKRIQVLRPGASEFVFRWMGRYRNFTVEEIIPVSDEADIYKRFASMGSYSLKAAENSDIIETDFGSNGSGISFMCWKGYRDCNKPPAFLDFAMPVALEGTSVLASEYYYKKDRDPAYAQVYADLSQAILKAGPEFEAGTYQSALPALLARQGNSLLPVGLEASVRWRFSVYGYKARQTIDEEIELSHNLKDLFTNGFRKTYTFPSLDNVTVKVELDLKNQRAEFEVANSKGDKGSVTYSLDTTKVIRDGAAVAAAYAIECKQTSAGDSMIDLPGTAKFRGFRFYAEPRLATSLVKRSP